MAKITNPLFSLSASGQVGRLLYRNTNGVQTARVRTFRRAPPPTAAQSAVRNSCKVAALQWAALTVAEREEWNERGIKYRSTQDNENLTTLNNGWALWLQEWFLQQATATQLPLIPT